MEQCGSEGINLGGVGKHFSFVCRPTCWYFHRELLTSI